MKKTYIIILYLKAMLEPGPVPDGKGELYQDGYAASLAKKYDTVLL